MLFGPHEAALGGHPIVVDGDTIRLAGKRIRLLGLDAPELDQPCWHRDGTQWACGESARRAMAGLLAGGPTSCVPAGRDRYGRTLAHCRTAGRDLGAALVAAGWAVADLEYKPQEFSASVAGRGIWSGRFDQSADWRASHGSEPSFWGWLQSLWP